MNGNYNRPKTLQDAILYFADADNCLKYMVAKRWPNGVVCPTCHRTDVTFLKTQRKWQCKSAHDHRQFSAKVGTIFEDSPLPLEKWLPAVWMICNCKNGVSSYELSRALKVTQKTAWFMLHRIRVALKEGGLFKIGGGGGPVEIDETFVGGKPKNMHSSKRLELQHIRSKQLRGDVPLGRTTVMGFLDREKGKVRAMVIPNIRRDTLQDRILEHVQHGTALYTDKAMAYEGLDADYIHEAVDHVREYVRGHVHTNGIENFWSLLKRGLHGTYVAVEPFHLERYVHEQVFRYNNRKTKHQNFNDGDRFDMAMSQVAGRRLTYAELTGKNGTPTPEQSLPQEAREEAF